LELVRASNRIERCWLDCPNDETQQLHITRHSPRGAVHQFNEQRVRQLVIAWQADQRPELLNQILLLTQPLLSGVILSRTSYVADFDETLSDLRIRLWKKLPHYDHTKGRIFSFLTMIAHQLITELGVRHRLYQQRYNPTGAELLDHPQYSTEPEVRRDEKLDDLNWRIYGVKTTLSDPFELEAQRWLINGLVSTEFGLYRHQAADSMSIVFGLSPQRSRMLHDLTMLEVRRQLLDVVEIPTVSRRSLIGTRGRALAKYSDQLSSADFSRLVFLMRNLAPVIIPKTDRIDLILDGFPDAQPLFPSEFGRRVEQ
jgi:hypothetical protein